MIKTMKKPIRIIKLLFLLLLFIAIGCNSNRKNNQASESQELLEEDLDMEFPNAKYVGNYSFGSKESGTYGSLAIYCKMGLGIWFELTICTDNWSDNSGSIIGSMEIVDGKGVYESSEYSNCIHEFSLDGNSVSVTHKECGNVSDPENVDHITVNHIFIREPDEIPPPQEGKITTDILWDILMKIPEDSIPEYNFFRTKQQRRLARINKEFKIQYENNYTHLERNGFEGEGYHDFMGIAGYLTKDEKKIIALFYYGGGADMRATFSKQTYEYDIATGKLKAIECLTDPFTEDEFFDESILTTDQLKGLRTSFSSPFGDMLISYFRMDRDGFEVFYETTFFYGDWGAANAFGDWDSFYEYERLIWRFYGFENTKTVRREWNGKRFVKGKKYPPDYLIEGNSVGRFKIGEQIVNPYLPNNYYGYMFEQTERTEMREGMEEKIIEYTFSDEGGFKLLMLKPSYDYGLNTYTDKTGEIIILGRYITKERIGIDSTIEEFIEQYPDYRLWWTYVSNMYVLDSKTVGENVQFLLDAEDCIIEPTTDSDMTILSPADFKKDSKIKKIRVR